MIPKLFGLLLLWSVCRSRRRAFAITVVFHGLSCAMMFSDALVVKVVVVVAVVADVVVVPVVVVVVLR